MSKSILLSIRPQWVAKILNGEKTIEVRKRFPKDYVGWVYIYCTKDYKKILFENGGYGWRLNTWNKNKNAITTNNGKVIARFWCDNVEEITTEKWSPSKEQNLLKESCLTENQLFDYCNLESGKPFYAIHISKLEIFDEPKELSEFDRVGKKKNCRTCKEHCRYYLSTNTLSGKPNSGCTRYKRPTKAPQNYLYIEGEE